jgi:hypothetical protein
MDPFQQTVLKSNMNPVKQTSVFRKAGCQDPVK